MNRKRLIRILGTIILVEFAAMLPPLGISMYTRDQSGVRGFLLTLLIMLILSGIMLLYSRNAGRKMSTWEDVICTGLCWVALSVLGALPLFCQVRCLILWIVCLKLLRALQLPEPR